MIDFADPKALAQALRGRPLRQAVEDCSPCSTRASTSRKPISSPKPACRARSPSPPTWRAAAPTFSSAAMSRCASRRNAPGSKATRASAKEAEIRAEIADFKEKAHRRRRPLHHRHRAPREPPHRQSAARPLRPSGRSRPLEILPVAAGRSDAHLRLRAHGRHAGQARPAGGRGDRPSLDQQGAGEGAAEGRGAQLRHAQEHPEIRQCHERPAQGHLRAAPRDHGARRASRRRRRHARRKSSTIWSRSHIPHDAYAEPGTSRALPRRSKAKLNLDLPVADWAKEEGIADEEMTRAPARSRRRRLCRRVEKQYAAS